MYLLDAHVLIALGDASHRHGDAAIRFFEGEAVRAGWATCPITENAFLRILGSSKYPHGTGSTANARKLLDKLVSAPGHQFWPDDISLMDKRLFPTLPGDKGLTDIYLLALAVKRGARFATLDTRIDPSIVPGGSAAYHLISASNE